MLVTALLCSPYPSTKTRTLLDEVLAGVAEEGASPEVVEVTGVPAPEALHERLEAASAVVFASPTYRADVTWPLKALLDSMPRGSWGETSAPLQGKVAATVMTGASDHHYLGSDKVRSVLSGFFGMQLLCPALYVPRASFDDQGQLAEELRTVARLQGRALVELARAVAGSEHLRRLRPTL